MGLPGSERALDESCKGITIWQAERRHVSTGQQLDQSLEDVGAFDPVLGS